MKEDNVIAENAVSDAIDQAEKNVDQYISVSQNNSDFITGMTVFIDG